MAAHYDVHIKRISNHITDNIPELKEADATFAKLLIAPKLRVNPKVNPKTMKIIRYIMKMVDIKAKK